MSRPIRSLSPSKCPVNLSLDFLQHTFSIPRLRELFPETNISVKLCKKNMKVQKEFKNEFG